MNLSESLFWDVNIKSIDYDKNAQFVVGRVMQIGTLDDFYAIRDYYGKARLKKIVRNLRILDDRTLSFCCIYFHLKPEQFRCYIQKQSNPSHWSY